MAGADDSASDGDEERAGDRGARSGSEPPAESADASDRDTTKSRRRQEKKKKKKTRRKKDFAARGDDELHAALDDRGVERPVFLLSFPRHDELDRLVEAFERGNYALVRERAPKLAEAAEDPAVRQAALELRRRIDPDPLAKFMLGISAVLLAFLVLWAYFGHDH